MGILEQLQLLFMLRQKGISDSVVPRRRILNNEGRNMAGAGVIMPPTRIANAYRGSLADWHRELENYARPETGFYREI